MRSCLMGKLLVLLGVALAAVSVQAQLSTNGILQTFENYITLNDTNWNGWNSNHFTLWQGATFANVQGVPGASTIGNDLGLELPIYHVKVGPDLTGYSLHLDSATRFETLFGDVHSQQVGLALDYNLHQVQLSAGLDARYQFIGSQVVAVPYLELKKASTLLNGLSPFLRYGYPARGKSGAGEITIGMCVEF